MFIRFFGDNDATGNFLAEYKLATVSSAGGGVSVLSTHQTGVNALLRSAAACVGFPRWSPDGPRLACLASDTDGSGSGTPWAGISTMMADGSAANRSPAGPLASRDPLGGLAWSPDGRMLLFMWNGGPTTLNADWAGTIKKLGPFGSNADW